MGSDVTVLIADVGGSNTRIALAGPEIGVTGLRSFQNDSFSRLEEVLTAYCQQPGMPPLAGACIAVAGPVSGADYQLTNRSWGGTTATVAQALGLADATRVILINDLTALGQALPVLSSGQLLSLRAGRQSGEQSLVIGIGTGFNVAPCAGAVTLRVEAGHASLPSGVAGPLKVALNGKTAGFATIEDLFSGPGLVRLHLAYTGAIAEGGAAILAQAADQPEGEAARCVTLWAQLLGHLVADMIACYLPTQGVFLAGSVARAVLCSPARGAVLAGIAASGGPVSDLCRQVPLWLVTDDAAGLSGAARLALEAQGRSLPVSNPV